MSILVSYFHLRLLRFFRFHFRFKFRFRVYNLNFHIFDTFNFMIRLIRFRKSFVVNFLYLHF